MLLCIEIMIVCQKYNVHIKNNQIIIILTPMVINTHSDSTSADILSFIRDIHCLSGSVWLLTSDYIQITSQCIVDYCYFLVCRVCTGAGPVDDGTGILPGPGISGTERRRTRPSPGERRADTRPRHLTRKGLLYHNGSI